MTKSLNLVVALALAATLHFTAASQSLSINNTGATADASAILDVSSNAKGMLVPRMDKAQRMAIASPATGLMVFQNNPDSTGFYYYNGTQWIWLTDASNADTSAWKINGNSNISASRFIGTLNDSAIKFRVNDQSAGIVDSISFNTGLGYGTLRNVNYAGGLQGKNNSAFGYRALDSVTTGSGNTSAGAFSSLNLTTGILNTANGYYALENNTSGNYNTAVGTAAFNQVTTGSNNVGVGTYAGLNVTSNSNTFVGFTSGWGVADRSTGGENTAVGMQSLLGIRGGSRNVALGLSSLFRDSTGGNNIAIGVAASQLRLRGDDNVVIGNFAGEQDSASSRTVLIGRRAGINNQRNETVAIGYQSLTNNSVGLNAATQGDSALYNTAVGFHTLVNNNKGGWNTAIGYQASANNTTGFNNVALGVNALLHSTVSDNNTAVGTRAGDTYNNGNNNTFIGFNSKANAAGRINATAIGANAQVAQDNSMVLGSINGVNGATASTSVGIGTTTPAASLDVKGTFSLGTNGTLMTEVIKQTIAANIPLIPANGTVSFDLTVTNADITSNVVATPASALTAGTVIAYTRVSAANTVTVYVSNITGSFITAQALNFYVTVIR